MTQAEIDQAMRDAEMYAEEDRRKKEAQQQRDAAENLLNQAKRIQKKLKNQDKEKLTQAISVLEDALKCGDAYAMKTASEDLKILLETAGHYVDSAAENDDGSFDASSRP